MILEIEGLGSVEVHIIPRTVDSLHAESRICHVHPLWLERVRFSMQPAPGHVEEDGMALAPALAPNPRALGNHNQEANFLGMVES